MLGYQQRPNEGVLQLRLHQNRSRTVIQDCYAHVPLRVLRPVYLDDTGTAAIYLLNPCGGVLGGDRYTIHVTLGPQAQAYLTTPSATKLYATPKAPAYQQILFTLHPGAVLSYLPEQTIPFANADFRQSMTVRLAAGAYAFLGEILAPGRLARQEAFAYRRYHASLCVTNCQDDILLLDHTRLQPLQEDLSGLGLLEEYAYLGTFYALCGDAALPSALADHLHGLLADRPHVLGSATTLASGGIAVRLLAKNHTRASQAMYDIWDYFCRQLLCYPAPPRRTV